MGKLSLTIHILEILVWYDGPQIVHGTIPNTNRDFIMTTVNDNYKGLAVELSRQDMAGVLNEEITLQKAYTDKRIGPYYHGEVVSNGCFTELTIVEGDVPSGEIPGDVMI